MYVRCGKIDRMELAELERMELQARARFMLPSQRAARKRELANMRRLRDLLDEPFDPDTAARGLTEARAALHRARRHKA